jgi:PAS domain S-box-containing protein
MNHKKHQKTSPDQERSRLQRRIKELETAQDEQLRVKSLLEKAAHEWRATFDAVPDSIMLLDRDHRILRANLATERFLKMPIKDIIGRNCHDLVHASSEPPDSCPLARMRSSKQYEEHTFREGDSWILATTAPLLDKNGDITGGVHVLRDITRLKETENALNESRANLSLTFENVSDSISLTKLEEEGKQRVVDVNASFLSMTGHTKDQLIGKTLDTLVFGEDYEYGERMAREARETKRPVQYIREFDTLKGKITMEAEAIPILDQNDECTHFLHVSRDISERIETEKALKKSETMYSSVVESSKDGIILFEAGTIKFVNTAIVEMTGFSSDDIEGTGLTDFVAAEYVKLVAQRYADRVAGKDVPNIYEIAIKKKDGSTLPVELNSTVMTFEGKPTALVFIRDLSARKKTEEQLKRTLHEKEILLREIHHRVKNNMQIMSSLLRLQSQSIRDKEASEKLAVSQNRIKSMALIHDSLYRSKDLSKVDFLDYIQKLTLHLRSMFGQDAERHTFSLDLDHVYLEINTAIPCGLIINELVSNSLKHAFPGDTRGEVSIRMRKDRTGLHTLFIRDSGIGFPQDLDFQATDTLGMNIVTDLVKQLDGRISLDTERGTEFKISFY